MKKIFTALWLLFSLNALSQNTYFVNDDASGAGNGTSWTDVFTELQDALAAAVSGDQVWVAAGIYYPDEGVGLTNNNRAHSFHLENGVAIYGGFAGTETQLSERNVTANVTILSGDIDQDNTLANNSYHVVQSFEVNSTAVLDGFTITGGNANGNEADLNGGGMFNTNSNPTLINCSFSANTGGNGGGMFNTNSNPILTNCSFTANTSPAGGGILNTNFSNPKLTNCSFSANTAFQGGGIFNDVSAPILTNCSFSGNIANTSGGGMFNNGTSPTLTNCSFSANTASEGGGGILNFAGSNPTMINCSFSANTAVVGGGIYNIVNSSSTFTNCILWGNINGQIVNDEGSSVLVTYSIVQGGFPGTGNLYQDPLFVDAANGDLHLQAGSPAIDAGLNSANTTSLDLDGNPRVVNGTIDMGAFEFQSIAPPLTITSVTANPATLWPPNHKMKEVQVTTVTTGGSGSTSCQITSVSSNEPQRGGGKKALLPDWQITGADKVLLRAEREGKGDGRIYTITVTCRDASGSSASSTVLVRVPHDQGHEVITSIDQSEPSKTINEEVTALHITASPNPSTHSFNLTITGGNAQESIWLKVVNAQGKVVEQRQNIKSGQALQIGQGYAAGMYIIQIQQGSEGRTIRVVKQ